MNSFNPIQILCLLMAFLACAGVSLIFCGLARKFFPKFRSGEHKPGMHRADQPATPGRGTLSIELPLVGGPALLLAILATGIGAGFLFQLQRDQWTMLLIGLIATAGFGLVGFADDWRKVYRNQGLSEIEKFAGVFLVSAIAAACYFFLLPTGQESYSFWKDIPLLNSLLCNDPHASNICKVVFPQTAYFGWFIFFVIMTGFTGTATSVAVDFSDGMDGLSGGLVFNAAIALALAVTGLLKVTPSGIAIEPHGVVLELLALMCAGGVLGYLPWNWPSSWALRRNATAKRRAKVIMGDCGALGLGGMLAMISIFSRNEFLLLTTIGGVFVIEALSVIVQTRVLWRFYRPNLSILRFASRNEKIPHTEYPLPFLATPLHHHFDLLGWDRQRLVYTAWGLGAIFALLSVMVSHSDATWQRYLGRLLALVLMAVIWYGGTWSKYYFVGKLPNAKMRHRRLALYYGSPYKIMGLRLFHHVESIAASEDVIETPAEELALWQRMSIFDARSMLGLYCYRAGYYTAAYAQWISIPERNRLMRPEIMRLLEDVESRLALETQTTQPLGRELIAQQQQRQQPIVTGNLAPADLPNPYEPVREEELVNEGFATGALHLERDLVPDEEA